MSGIKSPGGPARLEEIYYFLDIGVECLALHPFLRTGLYQKHVVFEKKRTLAPKSKLTRVQATPCNLCLPDVPF